MAKLGQFKTPTGATGSIFNIGDWVSMIIGAVVLIVTFAVGQDLAKKIGGVAPVDTQVDRPWPEDHQQMAQPKGPTRTVY